MNAPTRLPFIPPLQFGSLQPAAGPIGPATADFFVEEIPAYEKSGTGEHLYLWIEKREKNTTDVARALEKATGVRARDIGYAGMKDKFATTRQWFSLLRKENDAQTWELPPGIEVLEQTRHDNKLRTGHLHGNHFKLRLLPRSDVSEAEALTRAQLILNAIAEEGLINYFGPQRFGRNLSNFETAFQLLEKGQLNQPARPQKGKRRSMGPDPKLMQSVLQSDFFNRYAEKRAKVKGTLLQGEVVRLKNTNSYFRVDDAEAELPRFLSGDLLLTGVLPGKKVLASEAEAHALELSVAEEMGLTAELFEQLIAAAPGARRDLYLEEPQLTLSYEDGLLLSFDLPSGSFATTLAREFSQSPYDEARAPLPAQDAAPLHGAESQRSAESQRGAR